MTKSNIAKSNIARPNIARGLETRIANKVKRRAHILICAANIIAEEGLDALTIARLANRSNVTIPTVHNLLGKRAEILETLVREAMSEVMNAATDFDPSDTIRALEDFIDGLIGLISTNEPFYKAAFIAGERINFFEHQSPTGIVANSRNYARSICAGASAQGKLLGQIDEEQITLRLFSSQRLARLDWMHGYINLKTYRTQVLTGMFITLCADAAPDFKQELLAKIDTLK